MNSIINYCKENKLITIFLNSIFFLGFVFCTIKRMTINYLDISGNDSVNTYFYSTAAVCLFVLSIILLLFNIRIFNNKTVSTVFVPLILILTALSVALCIYAKKIPVEKVINGKDAYQKYSALYPLDEIYSDNKFKDSYYFEEVKLKNDCFVKSYQNRSCETDGVEDFVTDPKDKYLDFISFYGHSDSYRIKEVKRRRKFVSLIKGETDSEIVYKGNDFIVYDGEINYEVIYETDKEFFYATINRNKLNTISDEEFFEISKHVLEEYRLIAQADDEAFPSRDEEPSQS